jgi:predicted PurR-regulated permease PerM
VTTPTTPSSQVIGMLRWLLIAVFVVLGWIVLRFLASVLGPILAALGIAYMLDPVLERLVRRGMPRMLGAAVLLVTCVTVIIAAITFAAPRVYDQVVQFVTDLPHMVANLSTWLRDHFRIDLPDDWKSFANKEHLQDTLTVSSGPLRQLASEAVGGAFHLLGVMAEVLLIPVFSFYFLVDWPNLLHRIDHMIPPRRRREVREIAREIDGVVAGWVRGQAIVTTTLAILYAIGFSLVGMPLSLPIGLLVGALTVIPFVGTFVGAAIAGLVTIADGGSLQTLGMVGGVILCLHLLEAGVLTPKIVGHRVGLSESGALFAVVAGGKLLGFVGVVLAVPIAATVAVLVRLAVRYYEHTAFFGRESDADVVITPAMAIVMPGVRLGGEILKDLQNTADDWGLEEEPEKPAEPAPPPPEDSKPEG